MDNRDKESAEILDEELKRIEEVCDQFTKKLDEITKQLHISDERVARLELRHMLKKQNP